MPDLGEVLFLEAAALSEETVEGGLEFHGTEAAATGVILTRQLAEGVRGGEGHARTGGLRNDRSADAAKELPGEAAQPPGGVPFDDLRSDPNPDHTEEFHDVPAVELDAVGLADLIDESHLDRKDGHGGEGVGQEFQAAGEQRMVEDGLVEGIGVRGQCGLELGRGRGGCESRRNGGGHGFGQGFGTGGGSRGQPEGGSDFVEEPTLGRRRGAIGFAHGEGGGPGFRAGGFVSERADQILHRKASVLDVGEDLVDGGDGVRAGVPQVFEGGAFGWGGDAIGEGGMEGESEESDANVVLHGWGRWRLPRVLASGATGWNSPGGDGDFTGENQG